MQAANTTTISMGKPITAPALIPVEHRATPMCISEPFFVNREFHEVTCVSFGTPHGAVLVDDVESVDMAKMGPSLGTHALFPKGASIVFFQVLNENHIKARLWQRKKGEIAFTSEAACVALTVSAMLQKTIAREADVSMDGNTVHVKWNSADGNVYLTGPSDLVK